jgi:hypothetical protein
MMAETGPRSRRIDARDARRRHGQAILRAFGIAYLACALLAVLFALVTWLTGRLNPINVLVFALAAVGTGPIGLLALRGDYLGSGRMDEGQLEMSRAAQSDAFHVAYFGLFALFFGYAFFPGLRPSTQVAIGVVLLLVMLTWTGGYMWRRWRP